MSDESLLLEALTTINKLQQKLTQREFIATVGGNAQVAVVGMSCQFPHAPDLKCFWKQLCTGFDAVGHYPESRLALLGIENQISKEEARQIYGGYLDDISLFDPGMFGISPREANCMDPQQRLLMLNVHQALLDAGIRDKPDFANTGVFVARYASMYMRYATDYNKDNALLIATGNAGSISANRISYFYDLNGPSMLLDTACSSGLAGVDIALQYLRSGAIDYAIVAGVSLNLDPFATRLLQDARMLSASGRCKTFDSGADGYVPGEGVGVLVLQRLSDAERQESRIYSVIVGSAINQDGRSNGLTAPNGMAQENVIRRAFAQAELSPSRAQYIETHGTGTYLGDPVEIEALSNALERKHEVHSQPCVLGCLKTNIGHLEPAAGIASLIKASLCLYKGQIPPNNHLQEVNPLLKLDQSLFTLPETTLSWNNRERIAGVSSFGFGGVNGHVVLKNPPHELVASKADLLETYPIAKFNLRHCWFNKKQADALKAKEKRPFLNYSVEESTATILRAVLSVRSELPGVRETGNFHVGFYIEILYKLFVDNFHADGLYIKQIRFLSPLLIPPKAETQIRVSIKKLEDDFCVNFYYRYAGDDEQWLESADAIIRYQLSTDAQEILIAGISSCDAIEVLDETEFYRRYMKMGFPANGYIRAIRSSKLSNEVSESKLAVSADESSYRLGGHPGFLDAVLQPGLVMIGAESKFPYMTTHLENVSIRKTLDGNNDILLHNQIIEVVDGGASFSQSWRLTGASGEPLIVCGRARLQRLAHSEQGSTAEFLPKELNSATILQVIANQLECQVDEIDANAKLLELGMDSLMIMSLQKVLDSFELPVNNLFIITVRALIEKIESFSQLQHGVSNEAAYIPIDDKTETYGPLLNLSPHSMDSQAWLLGSRKPGAQFRLYCFPYGYLSASMFRHWSKMLPESVDVCPVELPGRGERLSERPIQSAFELAECLTQVIGDDLQIPYAIFGHSAGAFIGYVWSLYLQRHGKPLPCHLFAAAYTAPCLGENPVLKKVKQTSLSLGLSSLPSLDNITLPSSGDYIKKVIDVYEMLNIQTGNVIASREMIYAQLHSAVAQLYMIESFDQSHIKPLSISISALHGDEDELVHADEIRSWRELTQGQFDFQRFSGGHLFMEAYQNEADLLAYMKKVLGAYLKK